MKKSLAEHEAWFEDFAVRKIASCNRDPAPLQLKLVHTRQVLENARFITANENIDNHLTRICLLSALYHDISRFEQYIKYGTFKDRDSCNHGLLSVKILKAEKRLAGETKADQHTILTAVGLHNRFCLPHNLCPGTRLACDVVRAADKLDILRVMDDHLSTPGPYNPTVVLSLPDRPDLWGEKVIKNVLDRSVASYNDLRSVNDFRLLLGSWFFDLHIESAKRLFLMAGHARKVLAPLAEDGPHGMAKAFLLNEFEEYERLKGI